MKRVAQITADVNRVEAAIRNMALRNQDTRITDAALQREYAEDLLDASQGRNTVMYSDDGHPNILVRVPAYHMSRLGMGFEDRVHPGFTPGGTARREFWAGKYQVLLVGSGADARAVTLPGVDPSHSRNWDQFHDPIRSNGEGWHMLSNAEWAAIALLSQAYGHPEQGNDNYGRAYNDHSQLGVKSQGGIPGANEGHDRTLTGSGPLDWRHDGTVTGIADMVGNVREWVSGLRLNDGEINILEDPITGDHGPESADWRAILPDGTLVDPGTAGTLRWDASNPDGSGSPLLATEIENNGGEYTSQRFHSVEAKEGVAVPEILKHLALFPGPDVSSRGNLYVRNVGERFPFRGGSWFSGSFAGRFSLFLTFARSSTRTSFGSRLAWCSAF